MLFDHLVAFTQNHVIFTNYLFRDIYKCKHIKTTQKHVHI